MVSFEMDKFPFPMSQVVIEIKKRLSQLGSEKNNVSIVTVPTYTHPNYGLFDKKPNRNKIKVDGSCQTIEIDLYW